MIDAVAEFLQRTLTALDGLGTAGAIYISALSAGLFSVGSMYTSRKTVRERETINLVNDTSWDADFIVARDKFAELRDSHNGLVNCSNDTTSDDYKKVIQFLNYYELVAIGVRNGILSEAVFKKFFLSRYVKDWQAAKAFVEAVRTNSDNPRLYVQYEWLAKKWTRKAKT